MQLSFTRRVVGLISVWKKHFDQSSDQKMLGSPSVSDCLPAVTVVSKWLAGSYLYDELKYQLEICFKIKVFSPASGGRCWKSWIIQQACSQLRLRQLIDVAHSEYLCSISEEQSKWQQENYRGITLSSESSQIPGNQHKPTSGNELWMEMKCM